LNTREDGIMSRWARRKQDVREEELREKRLREAPVAPETEAETLITEAEQQPAGPPTRDVPPDEETRQQWIEELEAIDLEALTYDNDFTIFMKSWVPGALRQRALRKLWTTNPALAVLDGLNDYDLDYTDKAMQAGTVISSYMPGKGYASLDEVVEKVAEIVADEDGASEDEVPDLNEENKDIAEADPDAANEPAATGSEGEVQSSLDADIEKA